MTKKQKKMLYRILAAAGMAAILGLLPLPAFLWLIPYLIAGYDILLGALHGIRGKDPFNVSIIDGIANIRVPGMEAAQGAIYRNGNNSSDHGSSLTYQSIPKTLQSIISLAVRTLKISPSRRNLRQPFRSPSKNLTKSISLKSSSS